MGRGNKIVPGKVLNTKVGELEEWVREGFSKRLSKELNGVFQGVSGKKRFLARFQDLSEKDLNSNQITVTILENISMEEEPKVPTISVIRDEVVPSEKG